MSRETMNNKLVATGSQETVAINQDQTRRMGFALEAKGHNYLHMARKASTLLVVGTFLSSV